jgi:hypothetical protein
MQSEHWQYYKLCVGSIYHGLDWLIVDTLPRVLERVPVEHWFFLRYLDEDGLHLRVRLRLDQAHTRQVKEELQRAMRALPMIPASDYVPLLSNPNLSFEAGAEVGDVALREARYEPEYERFGGPAGVSVAERFFELSSELALRALQAETLGGESRKTLATSFMHALLAEDPAPAEYLRAYRSYWGYDAAFTESVSTRFAAKAEALIADAVELVPRALDAGSQQLLARWREGYARLRREYAALGHDLHTRPVPQSLCFNFMHLMNNRLGFSKLEEMYLATLLEYHFASAEAS